MLTVIVPVYNEVLYINTVMKSLLEQEFISEIVVVDDGSTDGTRDVIESFESDRVKKVFHSSNRGKGAAIQSGLEHATQPYTIIQDADLEYEPREIARLLEPLEQDHADAVFGTRFLGAHRIFYFWHHVGNKLLTFLANLLYNTNMTDLMTCYKIMPTDIWEKLKLQSSGFEIESEIAAKVFKSKLRVYEIPITYRGRGYEEGKKTNWFVGVKTFFNLLKYRFWTRSVGEETLYRIARMRKFNWWLYQHMQPFIGTRVLEAGCGKGTFTRFFHNVNEYLGIDVEECFITSLQETFKEFSHLNFKAIDLAAMSSELPRAQTFDTIVCMNVLEHIKDDTSLLSTFYDRLEPGGNLILLVPANPRLYSPLDEELGHYRRYALPDLTTYLKSTGFTLVESKHFNIFGMLGWWFNGTLLRRRLLPRRQLGFYDTLVPLFQKVEATLDLPYGLSLFIVARK